MSPTPPAAQTIAHLIESDGPGGAERLVVHLVSRLAALGYHNVVLLPARGEGWLAAQLPDERTRIVPVPLLGASLTTSYRAIRDAFSVHRPFVAHSHEFTMSALGAAAAWRVGIPHVFSMHGGRYYAGAFRRRLALALAARSSAVVAVSQTVATSLARDLWLSRHRVRLIPNGIPTLPTGAGTLRQELQLSPDAALVISVGNLYPVKGHADLIRALAALSRPDGRAVHLAIAGRGPEAEALRSLAHQLGVSHQLHLLGLREDIANVLRSGDVFALPSRSEGLPLALLEAMRAGIPIVATAVGEVPIVLGDGEAGLVVPPGDPGALARGVASLLHDSDRARRVAARALAIASDAYDIDRMTDRYVTVYREISAGQRPLSA